VERTTTKMMKAQKVFLLDPTMLRDEKVREETKREWMGSVLLIWIVSSESKQKCEIHVINVVQLMMLYS
jgi:hypothetical protein